MLACRWPRCDVLGASCFMANYGSKKAVMNSQPVVCIDQPRRGAYSSHVNQYCSLHYILRVPSWVCIYIPGYVYIPFPEIGYVKGMYLIEKVCKTAFTAMFPG